MSEENKEMVKNEEDLGENINVGETNKAIKNDTAEEEILIKTAELEEKIKKAVAEAIRDVFGEFLGEEEAEKEVKEAKCPRNPAWLQKMFEILPEDILRKSKLWKYRHCVNKG